MELLRLAPGAVAASLGHARDCGFAGRTLVDDVRAADGTTRLRVREVTHDEVRALRELDLGTRVVERQPCRSGDVVGAIVAEPGGARSLVRLDLATGHVEESSAVRSPGRTWCAGDRVATFDDGVEHLGGAVCDAHGCAAIHEHADADTYQLHGALLATGPIALAKVLHRRALELTPLAPRGPARRIPLASVVGVDLSALAPLPHGALESTSRGVIVLDDRGDAVAP
jgi:hypothetical protein